MKHFLENNIASKSCLIKKFWVCTQKARKNSIFSVFSISGFFVKKKRVFPHYFFNFVFLFCIKFHILKSQIMYLLYFVIYYYFNMQYYPLFQLKNTKNRKKWIFSCLLCAHSKKFYETTRWCYVVLQKIFMMFWYVLGI